MMGNRAEEQEPFGLSEEEGAKVVVLNTAGCGSSSSRIFGGGGGGKSSFVFSPATSMGVGRQTTCLS